jgi:hypothetical protein
VNVGEVRVPEKKHGTMARTKQMMCRFAVRIGYHWWETDKVRIDDQANRF